MTHRGQKGQYMYHDPLHTPLQSDIQPAATQPQHIRHDDAQ
jgi:hypothetical protein